jgi:short-subunit dehydrogenase
MVLTRKVLPGMLERGRGHLVFTSSLAGTAGFPGMGPYCATKAGLNNFVSVLRIELKDTPIRTTLVAPGPVNTRMWDAVVEASPSVQRTVRRLDLLRLLPILSPERLAARVVAATLVGRRHVRHPRRLALNFLLGEAPRRITEATLAGVRIDPLDRSP